MAKKFDIHEWQAKQRLAEQKGSTLINEKSNALLKDRFMRRLKRFGLLGQFLSLFGNLLEQDNFTPDLEDDDLKRAKIQQMMNTEKGLQKDDYKLVNSISNVADMYSYGEILDALESFYIKNDEQPFAKMARKHAKEFRDFLDNEDELDEASATGTGASFTAGSGEGYMSPNAFGDDKRKKRKAYMGYKEI